MAIPILLRVTLRMPSLAASLLSPTLSPSLVVRGVPSCSSSLLIIGMLMQLAALQARNGTSRPTRGGRDVTETE